jgi:PAS domain-containing protein
MSSDAELSTLFAEAGGDVFYPAGPSFEPDHGEPIAGQQRDADIMANTRKVWHDFLGQFEISSAILTVAFAAGGAQRHAFLLGFDHVRGDAQATQRLLAMMDDLWSRIGEQPVHHFQIAGTGFGAELGAHDARDDTAAALYDCGIALQMKRGGASIRVLFFRQGGSARFSERDVASLQMVAPLLADSATHAAQLARQSRRSAMLEAMFDRVSLSMALLSADGRPLFMNSAATALVGQRKWLIRSADGAIVAANPQQAKELRESIRRAATAPQPVEDVFRLDCSTGEWRLAYVVSAKSRSGDVTARCAMLILMGPGKVDAPSSLLEALGLLPSEQRFLGQFLKSSSLGNAAEGCGLSEETARTYLKRVRAKLGVHRQMELAGLISGLVLPLHTGDAPALRDR